MVSDDRQTRCRLTVKWQFGAMFPLAGGPVVVAKYCYAFYGQADLGADGGSRVSIWPHFALPQG